MGLVLSELCSHNQGAGGGCRHQKEPIPYSASWVIHLSMSRQPALQPGTHQAAC